MFLDVVPIHQSRTLSWHNQRAKQLNERRLARAVWSQQPKDLAALHVQGDPVDRAHNLPGIILPIPRAQKTAPFVESFCEANDLDGFFHSVSFYIGRRQIPNW